MLEIISAYPPGLLIAVVVLGAAVGIIVGCWEIEWSEKEGE